MRSNKTVSRTVGRMVRFQRAFRFPKNGVVLYAELQDQGREFVLEKESGTLTLAPILGLFQVSSENAVDATRNDDDETDDRVGPTDERQEKNRAKERTSTTPGRLVVYGDSNCIDDSHLQKCTYIAMKNITPSSRKHRDPAR